MNPLASLIFGLGLFFLGLQFIGDNLRKLIGVRFREIIKNSTYSPVLGAGLGVGAGALMQSATAVTFILVSMTASGLISTAAATTIIIWGNVGVTALAFVATLNIHNLAAFVVGIGGIVLGTIRKPQWRAIAGALLGLGLILIGLEQLGAAAAPMKNMAWFRNGIDTASSNAFLAFLAGIVVSAILQSNSGSVMLIITLAGTGLIPLQPAMLMIYGTNLGTIALRIFLATGLRGDQLRLVQLENFFCVISGLLMFALYGLEHAGVPLITAAVNSLSDSINIKLAVVFLLSNLVPALILSSLVLPCQRLLLRLLPDKPMPDDLATPQFLHSQALEDPPTAVDLVAHELARLLGSIQIKAHREEEPGKGFFGLSEAIETFINKLAAQNSLNEETAHELHGRRAELSVIRHLEESVRHYSEASERNAAPDLLNTSLTELLELATRVAVHGKSEQIAELNKKTKLDGAYVTALQEEVRGKSHSLGGVASLEDFAAVIWGLHRLAKLLDSFAAEEAGDEHCKI